jgi:glycogen synthase
MNEAGSIVGCEGESPAPSVPHTVSRVYVDEAVFPFRGALMAHMFSRDLAALHGIAEQLGVRRWFQDPTTMKVSFPHYDITAAQREKALALGAVAVNKYQMLAMVRHITGRAHEQIAVPAMAAALEWLRRELTDETKGPAPGPS